MPQIIVEDLVKTFQVAERTPGLAGAFRGLVKRSYRSIQALAGINFVLQPGELVGYIGPNGAGKSTTVKILSGILVPTSGRCEINGLTPWLDRQRHVADIGVVFGQRTQLWWDLPVIESFDLLRDIYRIPAGRYEKSRDELIDILDLAVLLDMPVRQLSLGQRMRCDLVASLLHRPSILFLDEPTIGLDAVSKLAVREFIKRINREEGITVILTTHDMDDIEALCDRIVVIGNGVIVSDGTLANLRHKLRGERRLKIEFEGEPEFNEPDVRIVSREGRVLHLAYYPQAVAATELIARITARYRVKDFLMEHPPIEELIAQLYRDNDIDQSAARTRRQTGLQA
ncbi:MAG: ATP-binding cassette domain-containing protein [Pseudomonadales bacterium]|jgi:ABC-2 type transport system ATP-binding protein|nr:ATP-binding cassette domain-containing protein [Pseudomonadales bacterium]MDP7360617.1 ATP-binding cassette domain-containing protein [Pseudomonadales bacterium]HJN51160.1 ATP-binding cassette domain-containing protein [Pseudomonadales bacterium]|tara:strand:+ start:2895 stop:3920 length:1026 start_codon:yes stop_codon:yes gene_type:complete